MNDTTDSLSHPANAWMNDPSKVALAKQMSEDFDWAMANYAELERMYPGESIAVWQKKVVAHGMEEKELLRQAAAAGIVEKEVVVFPFLAIFEVPVDFC
jgi:hypothetical protein